MYSNIQRKLIHTSSVMSKVVPRNLKGKNTSSQSWLTRQLNDPYVKTAQLHNFRCRSAFKLIQMNQKYNFLIPGQIVVDCGGAPGSWSQVLATATNSNEIIKNESVGTVIAIDLRVIYPINGVHCLYPYDFTSVEAQTKIMEIIGDRKVDVVLSDMAPNATGVKDMDHELITELVYSVIRFALLNSSPNAVCLVKLWRGRNVKQIEDTLKLYYENVKQVKPDACRADSNEFYILARNFKGIQKD